MPNTSLLKIRGHTFPPLSLRNCTQTLSFLSLGALRRTVNGRLIFLEGAQKLKTVIRGKDIQGPGFEGLAVGTQVVVESMQRLFEVMAPGQVRKSLMRPLVSGSLEGPLQAEGEEVFLETPQDQEIIFSYRPLLTMVVVSLSSDYEEWTSKATWELVLEEF